MIIRKITDQIKSDLFKSKIIILYGARQVGKTTLVENIQDIFGISPNDIKYIDCDLVRDREEVGSQDLGILKELVGKAKVVCIDEAQRVPNIGLSLKILHHYMPDIQLIVTGSSSLEIASNIKEPLTGRSIEYILPPLSLTEIEYHYDIRFIKTNIEKILKYGSYPEVFLQAQNDTVQATKTLRSIAENYLYKDILSFDIIKKADMLYKLIRLLALQIGSEISYTELGNSLGLDKKTIQKYIDLLEKSFVIFQLWGYSGNPRKEITRSPKIYFWDIGVRNALIDDFRSLDLRVDIGGLWENFVIAEKKKQTITRASQTKLFFWREYSGQEIDLIEVQDNGQIDLFEIKYTKTAKSPPSHFVEKYTFNSFATINKNNFTKFLL